MTWNTLTNLAYNQLVTETHMDQLRENIEHIGSMILGSQAISAHASGSNLGALYTGSFNVATGSGTTAVTGVGFQPTALIVGPLNGDPHHFSEGTGSASPDTVASHDVDGFTWNNNATGNAYYIAIGFV